MKQFEIIFRTFFVAFSILLTSNNAIAQDFDLSEMDSVEIGLITCSPHEEIYSLYGHTALRYHDLKRGIDGVYNWGVFDYTKPHFALRFIFGLTDYELGVAPTLPFCQYYAEWGSQVTEHILNLTRVEKWNIRNALIENSKRENRVYRYNFFYDNCSTRPRDIIERNMEGGLVYQPREGYEPTYREMLHQHNSRHQWTAFGIDLLLGIKADAKTNREEQEFLPNNLRQDFDHAYVMRDGRREPLVKECRVLVPAGIQMSQSDFLVSPFIFFAIIFIFTAILSLIEYFKKTQFIWFDTLLMLLTGLPGIVLVLMIFSEHPTTSINLQILLLNPLALLFIWPVWKGRKTKWFTINAICLIAFLIGSLWQDYAEGTIFLASCLLLRCLVHYNDK